LCRALAELSCRDAVLDGEIVALEAEGKPCFEDLQNASPQRQERLFYYAFDVMHLDGRSLCGEKLLKRKGRLRRLLADVPPCVRLSDTLNADPDQLVTFCRENRLEGLVAKGGESLYEQGKRSGAWQKFKTLQTGTFLVVGFLPSSDGFSALAGGVWRGGEFQYAVKLECYWSREQKLAMCERFLDSIVEDSPLSVCPGAWPVTRGVRGSRRRSLRSLPG